MGAHVTVTTEDFEALAAKLEEYRSGLSERERATLDALMALAGDGVATHGDVVGFGGGQWGGMPTQGMSLNFTPPTSQGQQGSLIGLLRNGSTQMQDFHFTRHADKSTP